MPQGFSQASGARWWLLLATKIVLLAAFVILTNYGFLERVYLLWENSRWFTLSFFVGIWGLGLLALLVAAFQPRLPIRTFWALLLGASGAFGYGFFVASHSDLTVLDIISLWAAKHETGHAVDFYRNAFVLGGIAMLVGVLAILLPLPLRSPAGRRWLTVGAFLPAIPIAMIIGILYIKSGGGSQALPRQYSAVAVGLVAGERLYTTNMPARGSVAIAPDRPQIRNILVLVDESVRPDYLDFTPGNAFTPNLPGLASRFVNYGPASSGGNCSSYSNAILRLATSDRDLVSTAQTSPTLWQYAKKAGFRTVYINAHSGASSDPGSLHDFMTAKETRDIDSFKVASDVEPAQNDFELIQFVKKELEGPEPVFIFANKNGAHFPYDLMYPKDERVYRPISTEAGLELPYRLDSYRNVIRWSVDHFFDRFFKEIDLSHTAVIYTSDHGQYLADQELTHCTIEDPDPRQGYVPMMTVTDDTALKARFEAGAELTRGHATHFQITPTVLELMGYRKADLDKVYGPSLFERAEDNNAFTSGDIFGLFKQEANWHPIDLSKDYLEPQAKAMRPADPAPLNTSVAPQKAAEAK
ncbi:MAG: sulfatase-like hydrolase/transferase [Parvibaculaceae bacterium]